MTIREFLRVIDSFAPFALAESWDNSGLMFGSYDSDVKRVAIALDPVAEAVSLRRVINASSVDFQGD